MHARNARQHHDSEGINTTVSSIDGRQANLFNRQLYTLHCAQEQTMTAAQTPCCMPLPLLQESPASRAEMAH